MTKEIKEEKKVTKTEFKPNGARLLVSEITLGEKKSVGGIILVEEAVNAMSKPVTIVAIGTGFDEDSQKMLGFNVGDKIEIVNRMMEDIVLNNEKYNLVHNDHVLGKYSEVEA